MTTKQLEKLKVGKPAWEAKLKKRGTDAFIEICRIVKWSKLSYQIDRVTFAFPLKRFRERA